MGKIVKNGITYGGKSTSAGNISYDNTTSELQSQTVQNAITELKDLVDENAGNDVGRFEKDNQGNILGEIFNDYDDEYGNVASGNYSHAEGASTTASGNYSHAEGASTTASGVCSHAEGASTTASGQYSHASGLDTQATQPNMTAIGKFNSPRTEDLFNIGNGSSGSNRSNIVEVNSTSMNVNGAITQNGTPVLTSAGTLPVFSYDPATKTLTYTAGSLPSA